MESKILLKGEEITNRSLFFFSTTLFVLTILISSADTYNYFVNDYGLISWVNLALNISLTLLLPFYLLKKIPQKLGIGIVVYLTVFNIFYTNFYFLNGDFPFWEQNYLRDIPVLVVYLFAMCLVLPSKHLILFNLMHIGYCIIIHFNSSSTYIEDNTVLIIASLLGCSYIMHTFLKMLTTSHKSNQLLDAKMREENKNHLTQQLAVKNRELTFQAMIVIANSESNTKLKADLNDIKQKYNGVAAQDVNRILSDLKFSEKTEVWKDFQLRFEEVHPNFSKKLLADFPKLTKSELKLAGLLKLGLTSKKIAILSGNTRESVDVSRSRLRKKLNLDKENNIVVFLRKY